MSYGQTTSTNTASEIEATEEVVDPEIITIPDSTTASEPDTPAAFLQWVHGKDVEGLDSVLPDYENVESDPDMSDMLKVLGAIEYPIIDISSDDSDVCHVSVIQSAPKRVKLE